MWEAAAGLRNAARTAPLVFGVVQYMGTVTPVEGRSMQPTLNANAPMARDAVLIDRLFAQSYERGDVGVLRSSFRVVDLSSYVIISQHSGRQRGKGKGGRREGMRRFIQRPSSAFARSVRIVGGVGGPTFVGEVWRGIAF
jgi:signal peptidase I